MLAVYAQLIQVRYPEFLVTSPLRTWLIVPGASYAIPQACGKSQRVVAPLACRFGPLVGNVAVVLAIL